MPPEAPTRTPNKALWVALYALIVLVIGGLAGVTVWQWRQLNATRAQLAGSKSQVGSLQSSNGVLSARISTLTTALSAANQTISKLSKTSSFVAGAACQTQQLELAEVGSGGGAAGSYGEYFSYQNTSSTPCTLSGNAGFLALDSTGHVMPNGPVTVGTKNAGPVTLAANAKAYFLVYWPAHSGDGGMTGCIAPSVVESTPPGNLTPLAIAVSDLGHICGTPTVNAFSTAAPTTL